MALFNDKIDIDDEELDKQIDENDAWYDDILVVAYKKLFCISQSSHHPVIE